MKENSSSRAIWSPHDEKAFCTSCVEQLDAGYICPRKGLPEECLENLAEKIFSNTAKKYTHKQLKNKWNALKKLYDLWRKRDDKKLMKRQTRGATNAYKNVVNGPPENLDQLMRMFDQSYASATCGEELVEEDLTIYTDAVAEMRHSSSLDENSIINTLEDSYEFATCGEELDEACQQEAVREKEELKNEIDGLRIELQKVKDEYKERCALQEQVQMLQKELAYANERIKLSDVTASEAVARYEEQKEKIKDFEERLAQADRLRKIQHNTIIELKGNIRVFCRVRPHLVENCSDEPFISYPTSVEFAGRGIDVTDQGKKYSFSYDKVFDHEATQENVFDEISQLVQSAVDGYKVCIFAYGQTGSGKTFTMIGNPKNDKKGIIPRSIEEIYTKIQSQQELNCSVHASISEIYCNEIRDLLAPGGPRSSSVSDLTEIKVLGEEDAAKLLNKALRSRSVARTNMNELSSRSHFVFSLKISRSNEKTSQQVVGALNLIDLAGSERNEKSGSTSQTLNEATAINKSLTSLSRAIDSVARGARHIPVRDTKLTMLLEPYLGGGSKTLMVVNIAPEASSIGETISSLRFASGVSVCNIGVPRHQIQQAATEQVHHSCATIASPSSLLPPPNSKRKPTGMRYSFEISSKWNQKGPK